MCIIIITIRVIIVIIVNKTLIIILAPQTKTNEGICEFAGGAKNQLASLPGLKKRSDQMWLSKGHSYVE